MVGERKLGFKISKFVRESDKAEVDDDEILKILFKLERELTLIAEGDRKAGIKVSTSVNNSPKIIEAKNLKSLKELAEKEFGVKIEKFVRKSDDLDVDEDEVLQELLNYEDNWLIAIESSEKKENKEEDDEGFFGEELKKLKSEMEKIKKSDVKTVSKTGTISNMKTTQLNFQMEQMQKELEKAKKEKEEKQEKIDKLKTLNTELAKHKDEIKNLEKKYQDKIFSDLTTRANNEKKVKALEAKLINLELKQMRISNIFKDLANSEKVDICFMIDATGSMSSYINEAKTVVHKVVDRLKKKFTEFDLRAAFVGYRDHSDGIDRVTVLPFTENIDSFKSFVTAVVATGGADQCEDIFGGLEVNDFHRLQKN
ncbi:unnamed protein product [Brachionus calyciflorus]|uniref:Hemicentin-1-like von Willebrand factor A domain-containing protein n=1 Tax=Brachionus calyciflorus TaxID=104777 RepID=A0A814GTG9_9BILA|nr:unnamed protein product [Brachionus calyciflorus]